MRSLSKWLGAILAAFGIALAALPFWMGAALPPVARLLHASVGSYERDGYSRFILSNVAYAHGRVAVTVAKIEADTPLLWLWRHFWSEDGAVVAQGWAVHVGPDLGFVQVANIQAPSGLARLHDQLVRVAANL